MAIAIRAMNTGGMNKYETVFLFLVPIGSWFRNQVKIPTRHRGNPGIELEISGYDILPVMQPSCCGICAFKQEVVRERRNRLHLTSYQRYETIIFHFQVHFDNVRLARIRSLNETFKRFICIYIYTHTKVTRNEEICVNSMQHVQYTQIGESKINGQKRAWFSKLLIVSRIELWG